MRASSLSCDLLRRNRSIHLVVLHGNSLFLFIQDLFSWNLVVNALGRGIYFGITDFYSEDSVRQHEPGLTTHEILGICACDLFLNYRSYLLETRGRIQKTLDRELETYDLHPQIPLVLKN